MVILEWSDEQWLKRKPLIITSVEAKSRRQITLNVWNMRSERILFSIFIFLTSHSFSSYAYADWTFWTYTENSESLSIVELYVYMITHVHRLKAKLSVAFFVLFRFRQMRWSIKGNEKNWENWFCHSIFTHLSARCRLLRFISPNWHY